MPIIIDPIQEIENQCKILIGYNRVKAVKKAAVDIKSLSEMLGHANVNITLNRYVHSSLDQKRKGINKLEQYIWI